LRVRFRGLVAATAVCSLLIVVACSKSNGSERCVDGCGCTSDGQDPCSVSRGDLDSGSSGGPSTTPPLEETDGGGLADGGPRDARADADAN
jgi:hypothetical protein